MYDCLERYLMSADGLMTYSAEGKTKKVEGRQQKRRRMRSEDKKTG